jgi:nicotinamide mononucleotide transporter
MDRLLHWLQPLFTDAFTAWRSPTSWLEVLAFVLAVAMVVYNIRVNPLGWPLAIISSLLYFLLFWRSRLYGEAGLQIVFVLVAFWGWWQWLHGRQDDGQALQVRRLSGRGRALAWGVAGLTWVVLAGFLKTFTDSDVPWFDALPTAGSLIGQWLLGRKYVENWPVWVMVNLVSVGLFIHKELWLTVVLYGVFIPMALLGWRAWLDKLAAVPGTATASA